MSAPTRLAAAAAVFCLLSACAPPAVEGESPRPVRTETVAAQANGIAASYSGEIRARRETALGFLVSGRVQQRLVEVGDVVTVGKPLFRIDPTDAALNANASRTQVDSARSQLRQAQHDFARYSQLAEKNYVSRSELEKARLQVETAEQSYRAAEANYRVAANQSGYTTLKATVAGVVTRIDIEAGQVVSAGQVVVHIAENGEREIVVSVPETRVDELRQARALAVELWAGPTRRYTGRLREMAPDTDAVTRTYEAKISLVDADAAVRLGMTGKVLVALPPIAGLHRLPLTAIYDADGKPSVWIVDAKTSRVSQHAVTLVRAQKDGVLIGAGLRDGDVVVTAGVNFLHDGQKVQPLVPAPRTEG